MQDLLPEIVLVVEVGLLRLYHYQKKKSLSGVQLGVIMEQLFSNEWIQGYEDGLLAKAQIDDEHNSHDYHQGYSVGASQRHMFGDGVIKEVFQKIL